MIFLEDIKKYLICDLNTKLTFHDISQKDIENMRQFSKKINNLPEDIFKNFFNYLLKFKELNAFFTGEDIKTIKNKQKKYLEEILNCEINEKYINNRLKIGLRHYKNNIPLFYFIAAYSKFIQEVFKYLSIEDKELFLALLKIFFLDLSIFAQTYLASEEEKLKKLTGKYKNLFQNINDGIILINVDEFKIVDVNKKIENWIGLDRNQLIGKDISYIFWEESKIKSLLREKFEKYPVLYLRGKNGSLIPVELSMSFTIEQGVLYALIVVRNIRYKLEVEKQIERLEKLYKVLSQTNKLITQVKDKKDLFGEIVKILVETGKFECAVILDIKTKKPISYMCSKDINVEKFIKESLPFIEKSISESITVRSQSDEGEKIFIPIKGQEDNLLKQKSQNSYLLGVFSEDISFFQEEEIQLLNEIADDLAFALYSIKKNKKIKFLEYFDIATKLPNRRYFFKHIQEKISKQKTFAVVIVDILNFKDINETINFESGDLLLKELSKKLQELLSSKISIIARIGGDEFGLTIDVDCKEKIFQIVKELISKISNESFVIKGKKIFLSLNAGIAFYPKDGNTPEELLAAAEAAVEEAKKLGKNVCEVFNPAIRKDYLEQLELEQDLKNALINREFKLFYQPIFSIKDKKIIGAEALVRWFSPKRGYVPPLYFIKTLEESGLIYDLGNFVIETAFKDLKDWENKNIYISINISPYQIKRGTLFDTIKNYLDIYNVNPEKITIEITETALMENIDKAQEELYKLKNLGISIAIDDFGTGYSSLSYLRELPFSSVKIDRSFIKDIPENESDIKISKAIVNLAHSLDKTVIAEGVETEKQLEILKSLDCDYGQGYLFSKPIPKEEFEKLLK